jgi:hypothetical protein
MTEDNMDRNTCAIYARLPPTDIRIRYNTWLHHSSPFCFLENIISEKPYVWEYWLKHMTKKEVCQEESEYLWNPSATIRDPIPRFGAVSPKIT